MNRVAIGYSPRQAQAYFEVTPRRVRDQLERLMTRLRNEGTREARAQAPKADSTLTNSILGKTIGPLHQRIVAEQHYARFVEQGTGPGGSPPDAALRDWVRVKGITPIDIHTDEEQMLFLIARSIRQKGIRDQPFMAPAAMHIKKRLPSLAMQMLKQATAPK